MASSGQPLDIGILLAAAYQEFVFELRAALAAQGFDDTAMEQRGYLERHPDPHDRRARLVGLSARGQEVLRAARRFHQRYERQLVREHGPDRVAAFRALLTAIVGPDAVEDPRLRALYL